MHFNGVYKHAYRVLIEEMKLFPKIRYNKLTERLNRHEKPHHNSGRIIQKTR
ncbi:transposase [Thermococcus sp. 2319x1]|nr:transposase [Thermococcus sp. 2319x1]